MSVPIRVYLDTSVISAYLDSRDPVRQELTQRFWEQLGGYEPTISGLVLEEIEATRDEKQREKMLALTEPLNLLSWQPGMATLVDAYLSAGAFTPALYADARHVATAVFSGVPILVSWNFRHLVNRTRRISVNLVNSQEGYGQIEIIAPPELE
jgi:predicted nucleic acid-binding protein